MASSVATRPLTTQVTVAVLALAICSLLAIVGFGLYAMLLADGEALATERTFIAGGLTEQREKTAQEQESVTVWDDAVTAVKSADVAWIEENLTTWMYTYYGYERVYILNEFNEPVNAMILGASVPSSAFEAVRPAMQPLIDQLRLTMMQIASGERVDEGQPAVSDLLSIEGQPALISMMPIVPSTGRVIQAPGTEFLHISVQVIDDALIRQIAEQYQVAGARLLPLASGAQTSIASVPLVDSKGAILGHVGWDRSRPGLDFVKKTTPALLAGGLLAVGLLWFLLRRLRSTSAQLERSRNETHFLAFHDTLTGLPNRALFEDRLQRAHIDRRRTGNLVALLYIDLDRFKLVNDTLGHPAGDELVRQAAARLKAAARPMDTVARLGGDEFAVIMEGIRDLRAAEDLSNDILVSISRPFEIVGDQVHIGASIGIALRDESDPDHAELLRKADIALYEAKRKGRGRYDVFAGDMDDVIAHKRGIEGDLRQALLNGDELSLVYQPIFGPDCVTIVGAEALIRWQHPVHGAMSPAQFIPIAEERGLMTDLGDWLMRRACEFAAASRVPWIAVNVSPVQLREPDMFDRLCAILAETGLPPERLEIEITEGVLLDSGSATHKNLERLRTLGIKVALDDFGTGYSSVNYLRRYGIDKLKVDKSFVYMLGKDNSAAPIVKAIVGLAKALNVKVTIEGIETALQRDIVLSMGCEELQGYLSPQPLSDLKLVALLGSEAVPNQPPLVAGSGF